MKNAAPTFAHSAFKPAIAERNARKALLANAATNAASDKSGLGLGFLIAVAAAFIIGYGALALIS